MEGRDGGTRKESRGRVKIKICIPQGRWVHVGNNLIAVNYYYTTAEHSDMGHAETVAISYITRANASATVTKSRIV